MTWALKKYNVMYEHLVSEHYKEPINGTLDNVTASVLEILKSDNDYSDTGEEATDPL